MKFINHPHFFQKVVHTMLFTLVICALCYIAVLLSLIFSVIERKQNILSSRDLTSKLSSLEMEYASKVALINEEVLLAENYKRVDGTTFAVRKDPIASYTVLYAR
jgi:hypothetical protein